MELDNFNARVMGHPSYRAQVNLLLLRENEDVLAPPTGGENRLAEQKHVEAARWHVDVLSAARQCVRGGAIRYIALAAMTTATGFSE